MPPTQPNITNFTTNKSLKIALTAIIFLILISLAFTFRSTLSRILGFSTVYYTALGQQAHDQNWSVTTGTQNAWGENIGWVDMKPANGQVYVSDDGLWGYAYGEQIGWISLNCHNDEQNCTNSYGVSNDGEGHLSGYAWGENTGWIDFGSSTKPYQVTIDTSGDFHGYAYGENIGWISFNSDNGGSYTYKVATNWRPVSVRPLCNNTLDDDADGLIDYPADTECSSLLDNTEAANLTALVTARSTAQSLITANAPESTTPGDHIVGSLATLTAARSAANATASSSQTTVDGQVATLNSAITAYNNAIVPLPAPTNLVGTTAPTCNTGVNLTWNTVSGATSYQVFRNGTQVATSTPASYNDVPTAASTNTYYVTAHNSATTSVVSSSVSATAAEACVSTGGGGRRGGDTVRTTTTEPGETNPVASTTTVVVVTSTSTATTSPPVQPPVITVEPVIPPPVIIEPVNNPVPPQTENPPVITVEPDHKPNDTNRRPSDTTGNVTETSNQTTSPTPEPPVTIEGSGNFMGNLIGGIGDAVSQTYTSSVAAVKVAAAETKKIINSPTGSIVTKTVATTGVVLGTVSAISTVAFATPITFTEVWLLPTRLLGLIVGMFGVRRKSRPWGTVYDSVTKRPLDPVYLTLINGMTGVEVSTAITDLDGRYGFSVPRGKYRIIVKKTNYAFPSVKMSGKVFDEVYSNLYFGDEIIVENDGDIITKDIPMDSLSFDWNEFAKQRQALNTFIKSDYLAWAKVSKVLFSLGLIIAVIALVFAPAPYNYGIVIVYLALYILKAFGFGSKKKGVLRDINTKVPLSYAIVRVYREWSDVEVLKKVTDRKGEYYCLIPNGRYYVKVEKKNDDGAYSLAHQSPVFDVMNGIINTSLEI